VPAVEIRLFDGLRRAREDEPVQPEFVVEALDEATSDRAIVTTGVGQHQMWACQYWTYTLEPRTWVSSHGLGTMGYRLPSAIGARDLQPTTIRRSSASTATARS